MENDKKTQQERIKELVREIEDMQFPEPYKSETYKAKLALIVGTPATRMQEAEAGSKQAKDRKMGATKGGRGNKSNVVIKIERLLESDFFNHPRTMREIQDKLQEQGYNISLTELSPRLLFFTQNSMINRKKNEKKRFVYFKEHQHHITSGQGAQAPDTDLSSAKPADKKSQR